MELDSLDKKISFWKTWTVFIERKYWEQAEFLAWLSTWHSLTSELQQEHAVYDDESRREIKIVKKYEERQTSNLPGKLRILQYLKLRDGFLLE